MRLLLSLLLALTFIASSSGLSRAQGAGAPMVIPRPPARAEGPPAPAPVPLTSEAPPEPVRASGPPPRQIGPVVVRPAEPLPWGYSRGTSDNPRSRIKDVATLAGVNSHTLTGYGLVAGLGNTGDTAVTLTTPLMTNLLNRMGLRELNQLPVAGARSRNVAIVAVTAELPAFARSGDTVDVSVASMGAARSLNGGLLLLSLLRGPDGQVYGSAQGKVYDGRPLRQTGGARAPVVGTVEGGGTVSRTIESPAFTRKQLIWVLQQPDLSTATRVASTIQYTLGFPARATGPQTVEVDVASAPGGAVAAAAAMSELYVETDRASLVVVDVRSGTLVAGGQVRLQAATISNKGYTIEIPAGTTVQEVVTAFNNMGAVITPEDLSGILKALQEAGILQGEVVIR